MLRLPAPPTINFSVYFLPEPGDMFVLKSQQRPLAFLVLN
jgi:hypothetical protein